MAPSPHSGPAYRKRCSLRSFGRWTGARNGQKPLKLAKKWIFSLACKQSFHSCNFWLHFFLWNQRRVKNAIQEFFNIYMIHVKELKIDQEKPELWGVGCQSPPDAWFSHSNFDHLSKKWSSTQMGQPILIWLVAFACIFEAIYDTCQKIKNRSRKSRVMEWKRTAFFVRHLKKSDFPIPILTSCLQSVIAPKRIDRFWCAWCQSLAFF